MHYVEMVCISLPVSRSCVHTSPPQTVCLTTLGLSDTEMAVQDLVSVRNALNLRTYVLGRQESADVLRSRTFRPNLQLPRRLSPA
jgi:hypothetical protein